MAVRLIVPALPRGLQLPFPALLLTVLTAPHSVFLEGLDKLPQGKLGEFDFVAINPGAGLPSYLWEVAASTTEHPIGLLTGQSRPRASDSFRYAGHSYPPVGLVQPESKSQD